MPLIRYDDLTVEQKFNLTRMYADLSTVKEYAYDFDEHGDYHGRRRLPKEEPKTARTRRTRKQ